jgi:hypothetical protein
MLLDHGVDVEAELIEWRGELFESFRSWREFQKRMNEMIYREVRGITALERYSPGTVLSNEEVERARRLQYLSSHVIHLVEIFKSSMQKNQLIIQTSTLADDDATAELQHLMEESAIGLLTDVSSRIAQTGLGLTVVGKLAESAIKRGKIVQRQWMQLDGDDNAIPHWEIYDPINVYHDFGDLPRRFINEQWNSKKQTISTLKSMGFDVPEAVMQMTDKTDLRMSDIWVEEWDNVKEEKVVHNAILVENTMIGEPRKWMHDRLPMQSLSTGESLSSPSEVFEHTNAQGRGKSTTTSKGIRFDEMERHAQPMFAPLETPIRQLEDALSLELLAVALGALPVVDITHNSPDTTKGQISPNDLQTPSAIVEHDASITISHIRGAQATLAQFSVPAILQQDIQRVIPDALSGGASSSNQSGYHLYQQITRANIGLSPPSTLTATAVMMGLTELFEQGRSLGAKIQLNNVSSSGESKGKSYLVNYDFKKNMPEVYRFNVITPTMIPDDMGRIADIAQRWQQNGVSKESTFDTVLLLTDPRGEIERQRREVREESQWEQDRQRSRDLLEEVRENEQASRLARQDGDDEMANHFEDMAKLTMQEYEALVASIGITPAQQMPNPPGTPPEFTPPENRPGMNPDQNAADQGRISSATGGSPGPRMEQ